MWNKKGQYWIKNIFDLKQDSNALQLRIKKEDDETFYKDWSKLCALSHFVANTDVRRIVRSIETYSAPWRSGLNSRRSVVLNSLMSSQASDTHTIFENSRIRNSKNTGSDKVIHGSTDSNPSFGICIIEMVTKRSRKMC